MTPSYFTHQMFNTEECAAFFSILGEHLENGSALEVEIRGACLQAVEVCILVQCGFVCAIQCACYSRCTDIKLQKNT